MDDYLMNSLFAASVLEYLFENLGFPWENPYTYIFGKDCRKPEFDESIGAAIWAIWEKNKKDFDSCYFELIKGGVSDKDAFGKCALSAAGSYFSKGYNPGSFLGYCAIVLGVATSYYEYPPNGVPETAVGIVALVLLAHQLTGQFHKHDGWDGLRTTSQLFNIICQTTCIETSEK